MVKMLMLFKAEFFKNVKKSNVVFNLQREREKERERERENLEVSRLGN